MAKMKTKQELSQVVSRLNCLTMAEKEGISGIVAYDTRSQSETVFFYGFSENKGGFNQYSVIDPRKGSDTPYLDQIMKGDRNYSLSYCPLIRWVNSLGSKTVIESVKPYTNHTEGLEYPELIGYTNDFDQLLAKKEIQAYRLKAQIKENKAVLSLEFNKYPLKTPNTAKIFYRCPICGKTISKKGKNRHNPPTHNHTINQGSKFEKTIKVSFYPFRIKLDNGITLFNRQTQQTLKVFETERLKEYKQKQPPKLLNLYQKSVKILNDKYKRDKGLKVKELRTVNQYFSTLRSDTYLKPLCDIDEYDRLVNISRLT